MITNNSIVVFHYTIKDMDGIQLDSSEGKDPLTYLHGANNIIPGLEKALEGKAVGDKLNVVIPPQQAYGEYIDKLVESVPRETFGDSDLEVGMRFDAQSDRGPISVVVTHIDKDHISVDGNHPLAGKSLNFLVSITNIRGATEEELSHGHAHGPGGHNH